MIAFLNLLLSISALLLTNSSDCRLEISTPETVSKNDTIIIDVTFYNNSDETISIGNDSKTSASQINRRRILDLIIYDGDIYFLPRCQPPFHLIGWNYKVIKVKKNSTYSFQIAIKFDRLIKAGDQIEGDWWVRNIKPLANGEYNVQLDMILLNPNTKIRSNAVQIEIIE